MNEDNLKEREINLVEHQEDEIDINDEAAIHAGKLSFAQKVVGDKFEVLDVIGQGGMGAVYKVRIKDSERIVALKLLRPELCQDKAVLKRFLLEAASLAELEHDNIVKVYDHGITDDGAPYLLMQYLEGDTLSSHLKRVGKFSPHKAIEIALQICDSLEYAHKKQLVHRDLKPSNMIVEGDGDNTFKVHLVDFGIAKILDSQTGETTNLTKTGDAFGTPAYMSPEQCDGGEIDHRSDIYSFGCVLYEMLTGKQPFDGATPIQVAVKHINSSPPRFAEKLPGKDPLVALEQIILKCMQKDRAERYSSSAELIKDLLRVKSGSVVNYERSPEEAEAAELKKKGIAVRTVTSLFTICGTILALLFYYVLAGMEIPNALIEPSSGFFFISVIGLAIHGRSTWKFLSRLDSRRTLKGWLDGVFVTTLCLAYFTIAFVASPDLAPPFSDFLSSLVCGSVVFGWLLLLARLPLTLLGFWNRLTRLDADNVREFRPFSSFLNYRDQSPLISFKQAVPKLTALCGGIAVAILFTNASLVSNIATNYMAGLYTRTNSNLTVPLLESAATLNSKNINAYRKLAQFFTARGDIDKAMLTLDRGLRNNPRDPQLMLDRGTLKLKQKQFLEALRDFNQAGQNVDAFMGRGYAYLAMGEAANADTEFAKATNTKVTSGSNPEARRWAARGLAAYEAKDYALAAKRFSTAIEADHHERTAMERAREVNYGNAIELDFQGRGTAATTNFEAAVAADFHDKARNHVRRALCHLQLNDARAAAEDFKDALKLEEDHTSGEEALAKSYAAKQVGDSGEAAKYLNEARRKGVEPENLKQLILGDIPSVTLNYK